MNPQAIPQGVHYTPYQHHIMSSESKESTYPRPLPMRQVAIDSPAWIAHRRFPVSPDPRSRIPRTPPLLQERAMSIGRKRGLRDGRSAYARRALEVL